MDTSSLMEQILSKDNLNAAYLQVVRNKGAAGIDGMTVEGLGAYLSKNGESIREQLRTRKYKPQPVRRDTSRVSSKSSIFFFKASAPL